MHTFLFTAKQYKNINKLIYIVELTHSFINTLILSFGFTSEIYKNDLLRICNDTIPGLHDHGTVCDSRKCRICIPPVHETSHDRYITLIIGFSNVVRMS